MQRLVIPLLAISCALYGRKPAPTPVDAMLTELEIYAFPVRLPGWRVPIGKSHLKVKSLRRSSGTRYSVRSNLAGLLNLPFGVPIHRVTGPRWIFTSRYEIYFETKQPVTDVRPVLRDILREKFELDLRMDKVATQTLVLRTPHGEPKLPPSKHRTCSISDGTQGYAMIETGTPNGAPSASSMVFFRGCGMDDLASSLSSRLSARVINEASSTGRYDFDIRIGGLFQLRREEPTGAKEGVSREIAALAAENLPKVLRVAAEDMQRILGAELTSEQRYVSALVVLSGTRLRGTMRFKVKR